MLKATLIVTRCPGVSTRRVIAYSSYVTIDRSLNFTNSSTIC